MCTSTGKEDAPLRPNPNDLPEDVINDMTKSILNESLADCGKVGLAPFCEANLALAVNHPSEYITLIFCFDVLSILIPL